MTRYNVEIGREPTRVSGLVDSHLRTSEGKEEVGLRVSATSLVDCNKLQRGHFRSRFGSETLEEGVVRYT